MMGIIESVLIYICVEFSIEVLCKLLLILLVEVIVVDYEDMCSLVKFELIQNIVFEEGCSIFMLCQKQNELDLGFLFLVEGCLLVLCCVIGNLIDNVLKYGCKVMICFEVDVNDVCILVEDEGGVVFVDDLEDFI